MPSSTDSWGIEVGANAIKAIRLQRNGQTASIVEFDVIPFKKVLTTPDIDADEAIRVGLDQFLSRHPIQKEAVVVSVPGHMAFARFAKLPPVEPKKVPDIVKFEAVQQIPFPIEQVEWDYHTFQFADSPDVEVGIFAITKERAAKWLANFAQVGLPVHAVTLSPVAAYNALAYDMGLTHDSSGTILLDIGTSATDLIIIDQGRLWLRTIPNIGGHTFTKALEAAFKLNYSKAEKIKREAATSKYARQIFQAMRPVFVDLVNEIQKSLGFFQSMNRDAELKTLIGLGSTFKLPGLQKFIKQQLQIEVTRLDGFKKLNVDARNAANFAEEAVTMAPAYGLALQGIELETISANILPAQQLRQQVWGRKKMWAVAATVAIAGAAVVPYARLFMDRQAYADNDRMRDQIQGVINDANRQKGEWDNMNRSDPRARIENLRGILEYRGLWPMILADVQGAVAAANPQPELLGGDPEQIRKIPRQQRNQVLISQVNQEYRPDGGMPGAASAAPAVNEEGQPVEQSQASKPPAFIITLVGTTPRGNPAPFLNNSLVKYLQQRDAEAAKNPATSGRERPYRITNVELREVAPVLAAPATDAASAAPGLPGQPKAALPGAKAQSALPGVKLPGVAPAPTLPGATPPRPGAPAAAASGTAPDRVGFEQFLPGNPLANEATTGDHRFLIQFRVELIRPEDLRRAQQPAEPPQPAQPVAGLEANQ